MSNPLEQLKSIKPNHDWKVEARERLMMRAQNKLQYPAFARPGFIQSWFFVARPVAALAVFLLAIVSGITIFNAAKNSRPNSLLFPVRTNTERAQLLLALNNEERLRLADNYADRYFSILKDRRGENGFVDTLVPAVRKGVQKRVVDEITNLQAEANKLSDQETKGEVTKILDKARGQLLRGEVGSALEAALMSREMLESLAAVPSEEEKSAPTIEEKPFNPVPAPVYRKTADGAKKTVETGPASGFMADILYEPMELE